MSVNKVILVGRLGRDPEMKYLDNGTAICNVSVATSKKIKGEERTEWHRVVAFGKCGELIGEYLSKGAQAYLEGELRTRKWTDKEGADRYTTEVVADQVRFLDGKAKQEEPREELF